MNDMFPPCTYAGHVKPGNRRFCRLNPPAKLVTLSTCLACPHAGAFSTTLEPICTPPAARATECVHRGAMRLQECPTCQGNVRVKVYACDIHGECVIEPGPLKQLRACNTCPDVTTHGQAKLGPLTGPANLMWFVYPRRATREVWERQQEFIRESVGKFDGKKVCAIACDDSTAEAEIDRYLWDEVVEIPNDPTLRELAGWRWAMDRLKEKPGFTVRLHAKGAWRGTSEQHMARWWELAYERLLDVDRVRESLQTHVITGPFRNIGNIPGWGVGWHYAGSFYGFRNDAVFSGNWEPPSTAPPGWYVEAWPAVIAPRELAGSVGWDGVRDLYQQQAWHEVPDRSEKPPAPHPPVKLVPREYPEPIRRSLIFHCFPKLGTDWRGVCRSTFDYRDVFNGRVLVSVVTGAGCDDPKTVVEWFSQFGPEVEITLVPNDPKAGINTTFRNQLREIQHEPGIVFKSHTKGISHAGDPYGQWRDNMAKGCLSNIEFVEQKFRDGYRTFGVYKSIGDDAAAVMGQDVGPCRTKWPGWHFPGAMHWFDPRFITEAFFKLPVHYYENEAFACHMGPTETAFAMKGDNLLFIATDCAPYFKELNTPLSTDQSERMRQILQIIEEAKGVQ